VKTCIHTTVLKKTYRGVWGITLCSILILQFLPNSTLAQKYAFRYNRLNDRFDVISDARSLFCLFHVSSPHAPNTVFRKVFLNEDLKGIDSVEYEIPGDANLISSGTNEIYTFHLFQVKKDKNWNIQFIVTDKSGRLLFQYFKPNLDFSRWFGHEIKPKQLLLEFIPNKDTPEMMLLQIGKTNSLFPHKITALDLKTGNLLWVSEVAGLTNIQTNADRLVGTSSYYQHQSLQYLIHFVDKNTGKQTKTLSLEHPDHRREIAVVASEGSKLLIAGNEYVGQQTKNLNFFMALFDLDGNVIFDRVDTTNRMSKHRNKLMGHAFDNNGNVVLAGEGYKLDATRAIISTATSVMLAAALGSGTNVSARTGLDTRIDFVTFVTLSTSNGEVLSFKKFPVGPWYEFANYMSDGEHMLIGVSNKFLIYDPNKPDTPPSFFTALKSKEQLLLTPMGPMITSRENFSKVINLELLRSQ